eukprot:TRINITY_DN12537_c0_g1_i1.p1 TRINITY_DN12537_c0_g1~~TRINITY_DN12537_c0_g1_i1.p1  ORF type:complete len:880 (+),score=194.87 TRINITY_DN12537_c0_g1_i1:89-2728(+)
MANVAQYKVAYPYEKQADDQLTLNPGEIIQVLQPPDDEGWGKGQIGDVIGWFHISYVKPAPPTSAVPPRGAAPLSSASLKQSTGSARQGSAGDVAGGPPKPSRAGSNFTSQPLYEDPARQLSGMPLLNHDSQDFVVGATGQTYNASRGFESESESQIKNSATRYRLWANEMLLVLSILSFCAGCAFATWANTPAFGAATFPFARIYAIAFSFLVFVVEFSYQGYSNGQRRISLRGLAYLAGILPLFISSPTFALGIVYLVPAMIYLYAGWIGEVYKPNPVSERFKGLYNSIICCFPKTRSPNPADFVTRKALRDHIYENSEWVIRKNGFSEYLYVIIFVLAIEALFVIGYFSVNVNVVKHSLNAANAFAGVLNLTCSFLLIFASKSFYMVLHETSFKKHVAGCCLRWSAYIFPFDKCIYFHEVIGWIIFLSVVGHTTGHLANFDNDPNLAKTGMTTWVSISGFILIIFLAMLIGSSTRAVRYGHSYLFYKAHFIWILFYFVLLLHGNKGFAPNFYKWFFPSFAFYVVEKIFRYVRAERNLEISTVVKMGETLVLEFEKSPKNPLTHMEGQYVLLNCPHVCRYQWHPFAITSAPDATRSSLHLTVQRPGTWISHVNDYFHLLSPQGSKTILTTTRQDGSKGGMVVGPDGKVLLRAYGPLFTPHQRLTDFEVSVVVATGVGVQSMSSALQSFAHHILKFGLGVVFPSHAYFIWVVKHSEIHMNRWMIRNIKYAVDSVQLMYERKELTSKGFQMMIYVTDIPVNVNLDNEREAKEDGYWGLDNDDYSRNAPAQSSFTESQLMTAMKGATARVVDYGFVKIRGQEPVWNEDISAIRVGHVGKKIGVMYCGEKRFRDGLRDACEHNTSVQDQQFFVFVPENYYE